MISSEDMLKEVQREAFRAGFYAGFQASGEGYNAEYPFGDKKIDIELDYNVNEDLYEALREWERR